jgi:hypothetical protein
MQFVVNGLYTYFSLMGPVPGEIDALINCLDQVCKTNNLQDLDTHKMDLTCVTHKKSGCLFLKTLL